MMVVHMTSPDGSRDQQYISNYATLYVRDVLLRLDGVGNVNIFGARDYSMRVWLDPAKVANVGLTANEVVAALRAANLQVAAGSINQPPAMSPGGFRAVGADPRPAHVARPVRGHCRQGRRRRLGGARARHRPRRARLAGLYGQRLPQQQDRHRAGHLPAARDRTRWRRPRRSAARWTGWPRTSRPASPTRSSTIRPTSSSRPSMPWSRRCSRRCCWWSSSSSCSCRPGAPRSFRSSPSRFR